MMRRVPVRELNQHTAEILALVERGERVEITRSGTPVAIIAPARPNPLSGLIEAGDLRPATGLLPLLSDEVQVAPDSAGSDQVGEDRESELAR